MNLRLRRSWSFGLLLLSVACGQADQSSPAATADSAKAAGSGSAAAAAPASASPGPTGVAQAPTASDVKQDPSAAPTASSTAATGPSSAPASAGVPELDALMKQAKNGVLPAGAADKVMKQGDPTRVSLVDAGSEPKVELKYDLPLASKETTVMKMDMTMKMDLGAAAGPGAPGAMVLPQVEMALDMSTADKKESNGDVRLVGMVSNVKVSAGTDPMQQQVGKAMGDALTGMKGMKISYFVTPKGRTHDVKVDLPAGAPAQAKMMVDQTKQSFENLMAPLPDEAVGVGGKWVVLTRVSTGADIIQWTTYTLKKRDGSKVELDAVVTQLAAAPTISGGQMPGTANIDSFSSGGTGLTSMDLTRIAPDTGNANVKNGMSFSANGQAMKIETTVKLGFSRK